MSSESREKLLTDLALRVPVDLREALKEEVQSLAGAEHSGIELLDALDRVHLGLGVAIGRGATGEEDRYARLGKLVAWLYEELGRPQNSQYAVVVRAAAALRRLPTR